MELGESLVSEELLEEASFAFSSNFKGEVFFEMPVVMARIVEAHDDSAIFFDVKAPRRSVSSVEAELHLCKQLGWDIVLHADMGLYKFEEVADVIKSGCQVYQRKIDVSLGVLSRNELEALRPFVKSVIAPLESMNRTVQKRLVPSKQLLGYLTMFGEAYDLDKGVAVRLGVGESLEDIGELLRFVETHGVKKVTFLPAVKEDRVPERKQPSSFYIARWIAETRIMFPRIQIVAGTWLQREAEVGLFLKAGANAITQFPALRFFNSEASRIIEEECRQAGRNFIGTLTDSSRLISMDTSALREEVRGKLERYLEAIKQK